MTEDDLRALARKYERLATLRARRDGGGVSDRALLLELRALAREFPGCLRELDTLGGAELARRAASAAAAAAGAGADEPWMAWISSYHALMRAALQIRRRTGATTAEGEAEAAAPVSTPPWSPPRPPPRSPPRSPPSTPATPHFAALADEATRIAGIALDAEFVAAVTKPPHGRIGIVVLRFLGVLYQQPPPTIAAALFPLRRPSPYQL